jgi:hypothetical protein
MFRRARANRALREAQRVSHELLQMRTEQPLPEYPGPAATPTPAAPVVPDFLPPDLRVPSRDEIAGLMMRYNPPLVIDGEVRTCPQCSTYRNWIVFSMRDGSVWLRCRAGHETKEPRLDAAWYNRNSGPVDRYHPTLEDGLKYLGH